MNDEKQNEKKEEKKDACIGAPPAEVVIKASEGKEEPRGE